MAQQDERCFQQLRATQAGNSTANLSAACGRVRCYQELTHQVVGCEAGSRISVCFYKSLCCLIRKSGLLAPLGKCHSPPRKLLCSRSLHGYWLMLPFWGYGYVVKWKRFLCIAGRTRGTHCHHPSPPQVIYRAMQALKSAAL